jgi:WD40 repeat protein
MAIEVLSDDVLEIIFEFVVGSSGLFDPPALLWIALTCKRWRNVVNSRNLRQSLSPQTVLGCYHVSDPFSLAAAVHVAAARRPRGVVGFVASLLAIDQALPTRFRLRTAKTWASHHGKVYAVAWSPDARFIASIAQDAYIKVQSITPNRRGSFDVRTTEAFSLRTCNNLALDVSPSGRCVAFGGLDNCCNITALSTASEPARPYTVELNGHDGYLSCATWVDDVTIATSSGDTTVRLWDVTTAKLLQAWAHHTADVMHVDVSGRNVFCSASCDSKVAVWDARSQEPARLLQGHQSDVNRVYFSRSGAGFVSASDDSTCRVWDMRTMAAVKVFSAESDGVTDVGLSPSAAIIVCSTDAGTLLAWDTATGSLVDKVSLGSRASCLQFHPDGSSILVGCWQPSLNLVTP